MKTPAGMLSRLFSEHPVRLPHLRPYVPEAGDPPIYWFNSERDDIVREVVDRVVEKHTHDRTRLEQALNDAALSEIRRLLGQRDAETSESLGYWRGLIRRIARMTDVEKRESLHKTTTHMVNDIAGNFDPRVYRFAKRVLPKLLTGVMQPSRLPKDLADPFGSYVDSLLTIEGEVELLRHLEKKGTLVYVPTHSSNLDSIVLGYALERGGLSPVIYGAGKNLFTNPIISFFMHNLGAYRVDRRIQAQLYKDALKTYAGVMVERGYHSLFFPGGTRSRSAMLESHLKLGLMGSAVEAFSRNRARGIDRPVWFVPTTINYALVLEAETLIEDWLMEEGRARYIIEDDEFSQIDRWYAFFRKLVGLQSVCVIRFGRPVDPFGNSVDDEGRSRTPQGREIDPASYVSRRGKPSVDAARDAAYTRELGELLVERYREETVLMATQIVAHVLFRRLVRNTPGLDLFARLRLRGEVAIPRTELVREVGELRDHLVEMERAGMVHVSPFVREKSPEEMVERVLDVWNGYHSRVAARDLGTEITAEDPTLLLYYQ
ncbi:MAG: 1-acyl-sn-glycerol-3-phosphate acyltransferase, partial [Polyangiales bacterium]